MDQPPRLFWRRAGAFAIDYLIVTVFAALMLLPFMNPDSSPLRLNSGGFNSWTCRNVQNLPQPFHDLIAPKPINAARVCTHKSMGIYNGRTVEIIYDLRETKDGTLTRRTQKTLDVSIDKNDAIVTPVVAPQSVLSVLILIIASAAFQAKGRRTPGKSLFRLEIQGRGCTTCRELRRLGPILIYAFVVFALGFFDPSILVINDMYPVLLVSGIIAIIFLAYYMLPWIRWRGAMPWDKATGFVVVKRG